MKIAFTGASGTGKTTLARAIAGRYGIELGTWGARATSRAMGYQHPGEVTRAERAFFQQRIAGDKDWQEQCRQDFVIDRAADDFIYSWMELGSRDALGPIYEYQVERTSRRYDVIFLCEISSFQNLGDDPARRQDPAYHRLFEDRLCGWYLEKNFRVHLVAGHTPQQRINSCFNILDAVTSSSPSTRAPRVVGP